MTRVAKAIRDAAWTACQLCWLAFLYASTASAQGAFTFKGINHVSWQPNEYSSSAAIDSRVELAATHANWASVLVTYYQSKGTSTVIAADPARSPTDAAVIAAIRGLRQQGLKIMLKPHVDASDNSWRGDFRPSNVAAWFASYTAFITHFADLAQQNNVDALVIGTEFVQLSGAKYRTQWTTLIKNLRNRYRGKLTYAANATRAGDEFTSVSFWDQLDWIGLDAYFPLTNLVNPTLDQLVAAWSKNAQGENLIALLENFANAHPGKPVILTEIGYRSVDGANRVPWDYSLKGTADAAEQRDCAEAMFRVWGTRNRIVQGVFWWDWPVWSVDPKTDTDYTPRKKPVEATLRTWFERVTP